MHVQLVPKVSIFMAVTTKKVMEKAQKWAKMARFWPKTRHNGRVMARKIFFHQCLWGTKFFAKFGHSRIPRTASAHKSFVILRCMWKEPAPFGDRKVMKTRPSVDYAKDWLYQLFPFPDLVWPGKGFHLGCEHYGAVNNYFPVYWAILAWWQPGRHNLRSFLAANSTQNYFLIAPMLRFLWHSRQKCRI